MGDNRALLSGYFKKFMGVMMSKLVKTASSKNWIPLTDALQDEKLKLTMSKIYNLVRQKVLYDGFVIKKAAHNNRWEFFCREDYKQWKGI